MTNTSRVRLNSHANPPKNQLETRPLKTAVKTPCQPVGSCAPGAACLLLHDTKTDATVAVLEISSTQLIELQAKAAAAGLSLNGLLRVVVGNLVIENEQAPYFLTAADKLDAARVQSTALNRLLADSLTVDKGDTYGNDINWGITELISQTDARLKSAIELTEAKPVQSGEVSS